MFRLFTLRHAEIRKIGKRLHSCFRRNDGLAKNRQYINY